MRAVMMQRGRLWVDEQPLPEPGPGEVLVKTLACGICGSDLHAAQHTDAFVATSRAAGGAFQLTTFDPVVLGHEFCAEVVDHGPGTKAQLPSGTLVCSLPVLTRERPVSVGYSADTPGGFAEYMRLSERLLLPVPHGLAPEHAALTEPMAVGLHAVNKARWQGGEGTVVIGAGPVGLAVVTALKARGIAPIIAADFSPTRRDLALSQGAHAAFDPNQQDPFTARELGGRELIVFECVGVPGMLDDLFAKAPQH
ncbi:MAG: alcohol dehydrogenase catalytic domain-containing protein, partial [Pseudomonadota bacterium]